MPACLLLHDKIHQEPPETTYAASHSRLLPSRCSSLPRFLRNNIGRTRPRLLCTERCQRQRQQVPRNFAISEQSVALYNQLRKTASQHAGWLQVYLPALIQRSQRWRLTAGGLDKAVSNSGWNVEPLPKLAPHTQSILASAMRSVVKAAKTASMPPHHSSEKLVRVTARH